MKNIENTFLLLIEDSRKKKANLKKLVGSYRKKVLLEIIQASEQGRLKDYLGVDLLSKNDFKD